MTFLSKILMKKNTAKASCKCGAIYNVDCSSVYNSETDERRKLCFYTYCKVCDRIVFLNESNLPRIFVRKTYKNHKWCS